MSKETKTCPACEGVMELISHTPKAWVGTKPNANGVGYRNVKKVVGATESWWQCMNDFGHTEKVISE